MTDHSKEPWSFNVNLSNPRFNLFAEGGKRAILSEALMINQSANIRRIVACVNACADESTEFLEFVVHEGTTLRKRHDSVLTMKETYQQQLCDAERQIEALQARLTAIGDLAHDKSTGPAVPDVLWEIRSMAYGN